MMWVVMLQEPSLGVKGRGEMAETTILVSSAQVGAEQAPAPLKGTANSQPQAGSGGARGPRRRRHAAAPASRGPGGAEGSARRQSPAQAG